MVRHPHRGSHPSWSGEPWDLSRVMDPHMSRGKARRGEIEPPKVSDDGAHHRSWS